MIVVRIELWSARDGSRRELARMRIANDGHTTAENPDLGTYQGVTFRGRSAKALDQQVATRKGLIRDWPRRDLHLWHLVARMLAAMGYGRPGVAEVGPTWSEPEAAVADALFTRVVEAIPTMPAHAIIQRLGEILEAREATPAAEEAA